MAKGVHPSSLTPGNNQSGEGSSEMSMNQSASRSGLTLPLNNLAIPLYTPASREDVEQGGQVLFENFVREEFEHEGMSDLPHPDELLLEAGDSSFRPGIVYQSASGDMTDGQVGSGLRFRAASPSTASTPEGYKNYIFTKYGRTLRELADEFSKSVEGQKVRRQAGTVNLNDITPDRFWNLLEELFINGVSTSRVLALFYFCSSLLIRAARENGMKLCRYLFTWSLQFIRDRVCQWVYENGGWGKVLGNLYEVVFKIAIVTALVVGIVAGIVYIKKNW